MTEKQGQKPTSMDWIIRAIVFSLLPAMGINGVKQMEGNARLDVIMERQEESATHGARIVVLEHTSCTYRDLVESKAYLEGELMKMNAKCTESNQRQREHYEEIAAKLESRIRAIENGK